MVNAREAVAGVFAVPVLVFSSYGLYHVVMYFRLDSAWHLSRALAAVILCSLCLGVVRVAKPETDEG